MSKYLVITIRFLSDRYHGRTKNGREPEWPPSPLRLFQAIVAGAASRWHDPAIHDREIASLEWLEGLDPPHIIAPIAHPGKPVLKYVPENLSDVAPEKRDAKFSRPTLFVGQPVVVYYWSIAPDHEHNAKVIASCSRRCHSLGWGIDMVIGDGNVMETDPCRTTGEMWLPITHRSNSVSLRAPRHGTMKQLRERFSLSLRRIDLDGRNPMPPLSASAYRNVGYRRETDPTPRPFAAFSILQPDASGFRAFDTARRALTVAGMLKCAAKVAAENAGWSKSRINTFILGHGESQGGGEHIPVGPQRFAYLPLPSIEGRGNSKAHVVGSIRRVLLTTFADNGQDNIIWARRLSGQELVDEVTKQSVALLSLIPSNEKVVQYYTSAAPTWATVTPVVLPGYDDPAHYRRRLKRGTNAEEQKKLLERLSNRIDSLLRKAIIQAGFSKVLAEHAELEWRKTGFWADTDLADRYGVPDHLRRFPRFHVIIRWCDAEKKPVKVHGPICIGGGRFYGLGLFARQED